jgi:hypothetical protein
LTTFLPSLTNWLIVGIDFTSKKIIPFKG